MRLVLACALAASMTCNAYAHQAPTGWSYDPACCSGRDCAQIATSRVKPTSDGWLVTVGPGDHPIIVDQQTYRIPYTDSKIRKSGDEFFHLCIAPYDPTYVYCFYVPEFGA